MVRSKAMILTPEVKLNDFTPNAKNFGTWTSTLELKPELAALGSYKAVKSKAGRV